MNDLERRLHHAARDLRAIDFEPPPLTPASAARRPTGLTARIPALVMPVLFVLGGLAVIAGGIGRTAQTPDALPAPPVVDGVHDGGDRPDSDTPRGAASRRPLTAHQEIALIASLAPSPSVADDVSDAVADPATSAPIRNDTRSYR